MKLTDSKAGGMSEGGTEQLYVLGWPSPWVQSDTAPPIGRMPGDSVIDNVIGIKVYCTLDSSLGLRNMSGALTVAVRIELLKAYNGFPS